MSDDRCWPLDSLLPQLPERPEFRTVSGELEEQVICLGTDFHSFYISFLVFLVCGIVFSLFET